MMRRIKSDMHVLILIVLVVVYFGLPLPIQIIVLAINAFVPDPIPAVDEVLMVVGIINKMKRLSMIMDVIDWMKEHKTITIISVLAIVVGACFALSYI